MKILRAAFVIDKGRPPETGDMFRMRRLERVNEFRRWKREYKKERSE